MSVKFYIFYADWCPHCKPLMETMELIGGPATNGEYSVEGTMVRAIEQKEVENPEIKEILSDMPPIKGYPTILIRNGKGFDEYHGIRDETSLKTLFIGGTNNQQTSSGGMKSIKPRRKTIKPRRKSIKPRRKSIKPRRKSIKPRRKRGKVIVKK